jgi:hypothetical protein
VQPYVIRQSDYLLKIAHKFNFDPDTVWNDPKNDALRKARPNPNILFAGDLLYIPDQLNSDPPSHELIAGSTNTFVATDPPTVSVAVKFVSEDDPSAYASKAYTVKELDLLTGLATDDEGMASFDAPLTLESATIVFTDTGESFLLRVGWINPIDTNSGVLQRLGHLGFLEDIGLRRTYVVDDDGPEEPDDATLALGLMAFQASQNLPTSGVLDDATADALTKAHGS